MGKAYSENNAGKKSLIKKIIISFATVLLVAAVIFGCRELMDYKYKNYRAADPEINNKAAAADIETIKGYFANFREWMNVEDRLDEYDFDPACIDTEDYFRLTERYPNYDDYTLWFFDMQTLTLYYIHTNI